MKKLYLYSRTKKEGPSKDNSKGLNKLDDELEIEHSVAQTNSISNKNEIYDTNLPTKFPKPTIYKR